MVLNKQVFIKGYGTVPYNRMLAVVYVSKKNINLELVKAGLVEVYQGRPPRGFDLSPFKSTEDLIEVIVGIVLIHEEFGSCLLLTSTWCRFDIDSGSPWSLLDQLPGKICADNAQAFKVKILIGITLE